MKWIQKILILLLYVLYVMRSLNISECFIFFYIEDLSSFSYFRASPPLVRAYRVRVRWLATDTSNKISISLKPANIALRRPENRRWAWRWLPKFGPNQQI